MAMILRELSKRLGQALRLKRYYLLYDAGVTLLLAAMVTMIGNFMLWENGLMTASSRLLFVAGALLILGTTARYWAWVIPEVLVASKK
jgi:hypothetical protein